MHTIANVYLMAQHLSSKIGRHFQCLKVTLPVYPIASYMEWFSLIMHEYLRISVPFFSVDIKTIKWCVNLHYLFIHVTHCCPGINGWITLSKQRPPNCQRHNEVLKMLCSRFVATTSAHHSWMFLQWGDLFWELYFGSFWNILLLLNHLLYLWVLILWCSKA